MKTFFPDVDTGEPPADPIGALIDIIRDGETPVLVKLSDDVSFLKGLFYRHDARIKELESQIESLQEQLNELYKSTHP